MQGAENADAVLLFENFSKRAQKKHLTIYVEYDKMNYTNT
jgi:hypothetical protein